MNWDYTQCQYGILAAVSMYQGRCNNALGCICALSLACVCLGARQRSQHVTQLNNASLHKNLMNKPNGSSTVV